jgi:hypothetical protein
VLFCISGGKNFLINDKVYEVSGGDVYIINQFEPHKITFKNDEVIERYVLQIHPMFLYENSTENTDLSKCFYTRGDNISNRISLSAADANKLKTMLEQLNQEDEYAIDVINNAKITILLAFLNRLFINEGSSQIYKDTKENSIILKCISFVNQNLSSELTLELVANNSYISINQLCRLFKKHLGTDYTLVWVLMIFYL